VPIRFGDGDQPRVNRRDLGEIGAVISLTAVLNAERRAMLMPSDTEYDDHAANASIGAPDEFRYS